MINNFSKKIFSSYWQTLISIILIATGHSVAHGQTIVVDSVPELHSAVGSANNAGGNTTILVADGTYTLNDTLYINAPNVTIAGQSGNRNRVIIQGDAMSAEAKVGNLLRVAGANFHLRDLTLQKSGFHLIQIVGEKNADAPIIEDCILRDAYEQMIKVSVDLNDLGSTADNGLVENCLFEYTAGIGPQFYIGGIDAHGAKNWIVRKNIFRNIISPSSSVSEYAVHFWNNSADNLVEQNLILDCDRGIGFGLNDRGNSRGVIRNNMIYHGENSGQFADVGIAIHNSPGTKIYNNTIFMNHSYPSSIEYRFSGTKDVEITNNLSNRPISQIDGSSGVESSNIIVAKTTWFVDASSGDLHISTSIDDVVDRGQTIPGLVDDFDGDRRPQGLKIDIGADEYSRIMMPSAPTQLRAN